MSNPANMDFTKNLKNIGTKLSDFEEVPSGDKNYFLLKKDNLSYSEKMKSKKDGKFYIVKKIDRNSQRFHLKDFKRETRIMIDLNHQNIIRLYGYFEDIERIEKFKEIYNDNKEKNIGTEDKKVCCLVLEFANNGSLEEYYEKYKLSKESYKNGEIIDEKKLINKNEDEIKKIINDNFIPLNEKIVIKFLKQLLEALIYLHDRSIIHRDIKPDNILLDENNNIKISDFGISALVRDQNALNLDKDLDLFSNYTRKGRIDFVCPEIYLNNQYYYQADIFPLGLTILILMSFRKPIKVSKDKNGAINRIVNKEYILNHYNEYLRNLVIRMIDDHSDIRPSAKEALNELILIEKYIESQESNTSIKSELDKKKDLFNNKNSLEQNINNTSQANQNNFQYNQNYQNCQGYQYNAYGQNNINNPINPNYQGFLPGNINPINPNQNNMYNAYANINNQMFNPNPYQMYSQNLMYYQNNPNYIYSQKNNILSQNMMNMSLTSQNMMNLSVNNMAFNIKPKITSLIRVLQCLYGCFEDIGPINNLKNMIKLFNKSNNIQYSLTLDILDILSQSINPDNNFINSIYNLRNKLNEQTKLFSTNEEVSPNLIIFYIFKVINYEYKNNDIPYNNCIFNDLKTIEKIPQSSLPLILEKIKDFERKSSPCYSNFYYLILDVIKCPRCNTILAVNDKTTLFYNFLGLPGGFDGNIIKLIKYSLMEKTGNSSQNYVCKNDFYEGHGKTEKVFMNTPNYLLIDFEGQTKTKKHLDENLDLTEYILINRGPNKYSLYAFIIKYNDQYIAYVKKGSSWVSYSDEITKTPIPFVSLDCIPYYAIYKGMN